MTDDPRPESQTDPSVAPPDQPLPPGAGAPLVPGPAMSVGEPIKPSALNMAAVMLFAVMAVLLVIVIAILIVVFHH